MCSSDKGVFFQKIQISSHTFQNFSHGNSSEVVYRSLSLIASHLQELKKNQWKICCVTDLGICLVFIINLFKIRKVVLVIHIFFFLYSLGLIYINPSKISLKISLQELPFNFVEPVTKI